MRFDERFLETDRAMSRKVQAIYEDPKRHAFQSEVDGAPYDWGLGPRGGKPRLRKTRCWHCGQKKTVHAETTENL